MKTLIGIVLAMSLCACGSAPQVQHVVQRQRSTIALHGFHGSAFLHGRRQVLTQFRNTVSLSLRRRHLHVEMPEPGRRSGLLQSRLRLLEPSANARKSDPSAVYQKRHWCNSRDNFAPHHQCAQRVEEAAAEEEDNCRKNEGAPPLSRGNHARRVIGIAGCVAVRDQET